VVWLPLPQRNGQLLSQCLDSSDRFSWLGRLDGNAVADPAPSPLTHTYLYLGQTQDHWLAGETGLGVRGVLEHVVDQGIRV